MKFDLTNLTDLITDPLSRLRLVKDYTQEVIEKMLGDESTPVKKAVVLEVIPPSPNANNNTKGSNEQYYAIRARITNMHESLPNVIEFIDQKRTNEEINKLIDIPKPIYSLNPVNSPDISSTTPIPNVGDIVEIVEVDKGIYRYHNKIGTVQKLVGFQKNVDPNASLEPAFVDPNSTQAAFENGSEYVSGNFTNVIDELESKVPINKVSALKQTTLSGITERVTTEYALWKGKQETDPTVYQVLKKYWSYVGWNEAGGKSPTWTPSGKPWSAAFISWIVNDPLFPKAAAHKVYAEAALNNRISDTAGWHLYSIIREKPTIKLGDIFVKTRSDGTPKTYGATHGDIVWKIDGTTAYLSGGNLGQTMKNNIKIQLNSDFTVSNAGKYKIVLKKVK